MALILLILLLVSLLMIEFIILEQDIISPSFVITAVFLFSGIMVMIEHNNLYYEISMQTTFIVVSGILVFFLTEVIISKTVKRKKYNASMIKSTNPIRIKKWKIYLLILFDALIFLATIKEVHRVAILGSYHTGSLINDYKLVSSFSTTLSNEERFSSVLSQLTKVSMIAAYICALTILHNKILCGMKLKYMFKNMIPILLWFPMPILKGGRLDTIQFFVAFIVFYYVICQIKYGKNVKQSTRFLKKIIRYLPVFFVCFYGLKLIMGIGSEINLWKYIFQYTGANLVNLEAYIQHPPVKSNIWGRETLYRIYNGLNSLGLTKYTRFTAHLEFRTVEKGIVDNCYTFFRRPLQDFGYMGTYAITTIVSLFYNFFYYKFVKGLGSKDYIRLLIYGFIFYPIVLFSTDFYIGNVFSLGLIITIGLIYFIYVWLTDRVKINF